MENSDACEWTVFAHRYIKSPHLLDHSFDFSLLAEHHVIQVLDPFTEIRSFSLQLVGPKQDQELVKIHTFIHTLVKRRPSCVLQKRAGSSGASQKGVDKP